MTAATSATVRKVTSFSPASMAACEAVARGVLGAFLPAPTAFAAVGLPGLELLDVLMGHHFRHVSVRRLPHRRTGHARAGCTVAVQVGQKRDLVPTVINLGPISPSCRRVPATLTPEFRHNVA